MHLKKTFLWLGVTLLGCLVSTSSASPALDQYSALRAMRPDGRQIAIQDWKLNKDVFQFNFQQGLFHLMNDIDGRLVGAIFIGDGDLRFSPDDPREIQNLRVMATDPEATGFGDSFTKIMLLFADDTAEQLLAAGEVTTASPNAAAISFREECLRREKRDFRTNFHLRTFQDLMNPPSKAGVFMAFIDFDNHPHSLVAVDPLGIDNLWVGENAGFGVDGPEEAALVFMGDNNRGVVYLSHLAEERAKGADKRCRRKHLIDAEHYSIRTTIQSNLKVDGQTELTFTASQRNMRLVPIRLMLPLRIQEVEWVQGERQTPLEFIQEEPPTDLGSLAVEGADVAILFPEPLVRGAKSTIRIRYSGDEVMEDAGDDNYFVGTRTRWYPSTGSFSDWATYDLEFLHPEGTNIVSIGEHLGEGTAEGRHISRWQSTVPIQVAGFNYGRFKAIEQVEPVSGANIQIYTNPGTPSIIGQINAVLASRAAAQQRQFASDLLVNDPNYQGYIPSGNSTATQSFKVSTDSLSQNALIDGINSVKLYSTLFGAQPHKRIAVTQQSNWLIGQSWPTLIYMPYVSFISATDRQKIFEGQQLNDLRVFVDSVGLHEMAHQWWGNAVGWESYRDQWLSEGLAEFSAVIAMEAIDGPEKANRHWAELLRGLTEPGGGAGSMRPYEVGPVTQGVRLETRRSPNAYQGVVYNKGAFIFQTLRMLMRDTSAKIPDQTFFSMLKDFATQFAGKNASTEDFRKHVQKHMVAGLNARGDGKVDWFFDQWVEGHEMPHYEVDVEISKTGGKYRILGSVTQQNVSDQFMAMVPFYVDFGKGSIAIVGKAPFIGTQTRQIDQTIALPKKPKGFLINGNYENPYTIKATASAAKQKKGKKKK